MLARGQGANEGIKLWAVSNQAPHLHIGDGEGVNRQTLLGVFGGFCRWKLGKKFFVQFGRKLGTSLRRSMKPELNQMPTAKVVSNVHRDHDL